MNLEGPENITGEREINWGRTGRTFGGKRNVREDTQMTELHMRYLSEEVREVNSGNKGDRIYFLGQRMREKCEKKGVGRVVVGRCGTGDGLLRGFKKTSKARVAVDRTLT